MNGFGYSLILKTGFSHLYCISSNVA